jgi:hypothetical protein
VLHTGVFSGDELTPSIGTVTASQTLTANANTDPTGLYKPGFMVTAAPCAPANDGIDVWYKFQIGCGGNVIGSVSTCDPFTDYDTILTLYRGTCDGLILIECNDDYTGNRAPARRAVSQVTGQPSNAWSCYYYKVFQAATEQLARSSQH